MLKKKFAAVSVAVLAAFLILPAATAANAATYVPEENITFPAITQPGETAVISVPAGSFVPNESVVYSVSGDTAVTFGIFKSAAVVSTHATVATATGASSVSVILPTNATGTYSVSALSASGITLPAVAIGTPIADAGAAAASGDLAATGDLASTGFNAPLLVIWGAVGVILLGVAMVAVLRLKRRSAASAVAAA